MLNIKIDTKKFTDINEGICLTLYKLAGFFDLCGLGEYDSGAVLDADNQHVGNWTLTPKERVTNNTFLLECTGIFDHRPTPEISVEVRSYRAKRTVNDNGDRTTTTLEFWALSDKEAALKVAKDYPGATVLGPRLDFVNHRGE